MTKRLARLILLAVWATLIAGSVVAYVTTRSVLVADLDARLMEKAASLPQIISNPGEEAALVFVPDPEDRFIVENGAGKTLVRPHGTPMSLVKPVIVHASFLSLDEGPRMRSITVKVLAKQPPPAPPGAPLEPVTVVYTGSAQRLDQLLSRLGIALVAFDILGGMAAWMLAVRMSRIALRPLTGAAEVIGTIDETHLDRRIETKDLPDELMPVATRLNELLDRLQQAFAQRRQFLADASHELRTPVAALVTTIEVALRRPREAGEYKTTFETCLSEATLLKGLVQRLMDQARSENFDHNEEPSGVDVTAVLNECADAATALSESSGLKVVRNFPNDLRLRTQHNRLRSIVMNLVGNAVEYNRPGGTVEIIAQQPIDKKSLDMTVRDSGKGIAAEHLPHLFEPFYRVDKSRKRDPNHLGLGLFLVRSHVRALRGDCRVESTLGEGTAFHVEIPETHAEVDNIPMINESMRNEEKVQRA